MNFSSIFIKKPIMTVLLVVTVVAFGIASYFKLPISDLPEIQSPVITISAYYPGASPETMASAVAAPLESECMQIPGLSSVISKSTEGKTEIILTFELDKNVDMAAPDVQAAITRAAGSLPSLPNPPAYTKYNPSDSPIIYILLSSETMDPGALYDIAKKRVAQRINMIEGVSEVDCYGIKTAAVIELNPDRMAAHGLGYEDISLALHNSTIMTPGGSINGHYKAFTITPQGQLTDQKEYNDLIVKAVNNSPLTIGNIGKATKGTSSDLLNVAFFKKGQGYSSKSSMIVVRRTAGSNTIELNDKIIRLLDQLRKEVPGSVKLEVLYDRSKKIIDSINDVQFTLFLAFILVVLVIFIFIGRVSDTVIPVIALPLSIIMTFLIMSIAGFTIDNLSLMALTLAVGFVVDDAIVVLENSVRLVEKGMPPFEAAIQSAKEITSTIVSMTLSLVTVFIPLIFMSGVVGRTFREFSLTVIITVLCSGIISLTLSPMMCARMLKSATRETDKTRLQKLMNWIVNRMIQGYGKILKIILNHKYASVIIWLVCLLGTFWLYSLVPKGFLPVGDSGLIRGGIIAPLGTSSEMMHKYQDSINQIMEKDPNVELFISLTGESSGADQSTGFLFTILKKRSERPEIMTVVAEMWEKLVNNNFPLGFTFIQAQPVLKISTGGESTAQGSKYSYSITGPKSEAIYRCAQQLGDEMNKNSTFQGVQTSVKLNMPQLKINILRERASMFGITAKDIEQSLALAFSKGRVAQYVTDIDQYDVIMKVQPNFQAKPEDIKKLHIKSSTTGQLVPFDNVATIEQTLGPQQVQHSQQLISASVSFNVISGIPLSVATDKVQKLAEKILEPGMSGKFEGEALEFQKSVTSITILILVAVFLMYVILGILYESYINPFTVLTTLPVAAFGGIGTLLIFGSQLDLYAYVGLFMLLGIIAKNGIMMVDFAKQNREKGENKFDSIYDACLVRFRPILMTGLAAIMGALPIALGIGADGESRRPLGLVIVGGLTFAQIITLFVTPGIYLYMESFQEKFLDKFELTMSDAARKEMESKKSS